jgi:hypothetical protein
MAKDAIDLTLSSIRSDRKLHYENYQVVSAVQACCGSITPNMTAVSLRCVDEEVHLYFYLESESLIDREEIEDVVAELACLQFTDVPIITHVSVTGPRASATQIEGRPIYRRHNGSD